MVVAASAILVLLAVYLVASDRYPIAMVNGQAIGAKRFRSQYRAAQTYLGNARKAVAGTSTSSNIPDSELQAVVLDQLIESTLAQQGAEKEVGGDLDYLVENKMANYDSDQKLAAAASGLYGISYADFRKDFLVPQAEADILLGRLYLRGEKLEDWLKNARASARVSIFSSKFRWDGSKVMAN